MLTAHAQSYSYVIASTEPRNLNSDPLETLWGLKFGHASERATKPVRHIAPV